MAPRRRRWGETRAALWPFMRGIGEQYLVAGPIFGLLAALYGFHLSQSAALTANPATHEIIRQTQSFHGQLQREYFITPAQNAVLIGLSVPAVIWLILLVLVVIGLGVRRHYRSRHGAAH